jgi:hypothetical protein
MKRKSGKVYRRREPRQRRARVTVEAVLDAVVRILKREGFEALTTNRIAEVAGVSIGSVYQYFSARSLPRCTNAISGRSIAWWKRSSWSMPRRRWLR